MIVLRFLQAIGGGFSTVICMATVRDIYPVEQLGRRFATVTMVVLDRAARGADDRHLVLPLGWQVVFYLKAAYAACLLAAYSVLVPETRHGHWANLSLRSIFRQCADVVTRRVDGRLLADPLCVRDGARDERADDLRHERVVHLPAVLRRAGEPIPVSVRR